MHSSIGGLLGCLCISAIVNSVAVNTGVHVSFWIRAFHKGTRHRLWPGKRVAHLPGCCRMPGLRTLRGRCPKSEGPWLSPRSPAERLAERSSDPGQGTQPSETSQEGASNKYPDLSFPVSPLSHHCSPLAEHHSTTSGQSLHQRSVSQGTEQGGEG